MDHFAIACFMVTSVASFTFVQGATIQVPCKNDTDCMSGQCCYFEPEFLIMSRRDSVLPAVDLPLPPVHAKHDTGVCENYHQIGDHCNGFEKLNGHCGCGTGLSCQWVPLGIPPTVTVSRHRRSPPYHQGPGSYQCIRRN